MTSNNDNHPHWTIRTLKQARRIIMIVVGFTVLAIGIAMIVLPGPATIVIPIGLAILATEFVWAERLLKKMKEKFKEAQDKIMKTNSNTKK